MSRFVKGISFVGLTIAMFMGTLDSTIVNIALPKIMTHFNASLTNTSWVTTIYTLALAVFMITASKIADRYGRKKVMLIGLLLFGGFSAACTLATSLGMLIVFRFCQGIGGAIITPIVLPMGIEVFGKTNMGKVASAVGAVTALAAAGGPPLGGILLEYTSWRWVFGVNVPLTVLALIIIAIWVQESKDNTLAGHIDVWGTLLLTLGLGGITFGLLEGRQYGWSSLLILSSLIGGFVALGLFIGVEAKVKNPLLELDLFKEKTLSASSLVYFMTGFALVSPALIMNYFLQDVLNDTALQAALILIPVSLTIVVAMPLGTRILSAKGAIPVTFGGLVIIAGSLLALSSITTTTSKTTMVLILILNGIGFGFASVSLVASVKYLPQNKSGIGSGIVNAARQIGTCLGVAILVTTLDNHVATAKNTIRQNGIATVTKANLAPRVKNVAKNQLTQVFTTGDNAIGAKGGQSQLITAVAKAAKGTQDLPKPQGNSTTAKLYRASVRLHQGLSQVHNGSQRLTATMMGLGANPQRQAVAQQLGTASGKITAGTGQLAQKQQAFSTALQQLAQKQVLTRVFTTIKKDKNQQLSQAFSRTYLLSALIVLVISPVAFWTDRHKVKASN